MPKLIKLQVKLNIEYQSQHYPTKSDNCAIFETAILNTMQAKCTIILVSPFFHKQLAM